MNEQDIINEFKAAGAMLSGHFILSSGLHSPTYLQCARVLMDGARGERLCKALAAKIMSSPVASADAPMGQSSGLVRATALSSHGFDCIVAPAMGGVVVGYEMGRQLGIPAMFCERVEGKFELRRGFALEEGAKVLVVEDVVTTGKSSMEAVECITRNGGKALAVASLIDRRGTNDVSLTLPLISLLKLDVPTYAPDKLPPELLDIPAIKPGSRDLKK
ncbi:MAG: phosphoribosyltransferase family protein [Alphaproteobacteria bacterium]|nr:phosphoribosyltransferase family protein [Alphaproteobacteria bacterium]